MQTGTIFYDFHCHDGRPEPGVVKFVSLPEAEFRAAPEAPGIFYSLQLHPWHEPEMTASYAELARTEKALALGEAGLDRRCRTPFDRQQTAFRAVLDLAEELQKPVVIHCVAAWSELFAAVAGRRLPCKLLHGFHGSPELLKQLIRHGFTVAFSPEAWRKPDLRELLESDSAIRAVCVPESDMSAEPLRFRLPGGCVWRPCCDVLLRITPADETYSAACGLLRLLSLFQQRGWKNDER